MSEFKVKLSGMLQRMSEEQRIRSSLSPLGDDLRRVQSALNLDTGSLEELKKSLKKLADTLDGYEKDMKNMHTVLINAKNQYEKTERRICGYINDHPITVEDVWEAFTTLGKGLAVSALHPGTGLTWLVDTILQDAERENKFEPGVSDYKIKELPKSLKKVISDEHYEYDEESGKLVKKEKEEKAEDSKKKKILDSIKIWSGGFSEEGSLLHFGKDDDVETEWGHYTYSGDFMKAERSATAYAGLGGAGFEMGVALTALSGGFDVQAGTEDFGAHAGVEIELGKVSASTEGKIELWDENGDFQPNVGFSAKMEAIAAEASGEVGVDLLGTKANLKGSVNFGIGGHADVGFKDGKLSLDVGASLGIGGSLKFEADVSGTVDKVVEHAAEIGDAAWDACKAATSFVADAADKAGSAIADFGKDVGKGFKNGLSAVKGFFGKR